MRIWSTATCTPSGPSGAKCASRAARAAARAICDSNHAAETAMRSRDTRFLRRFSFARLSYMRSYVPSRWMWMMVARR